MLLAITFYNKIPYNFTQNDARKFRVGEQGGMKVSLALQKNMIDLREAHPNLKEKYGKFPFGIGTPITITTHEPIKINTLPFKELLEKTETIIKEHIK